MKYENIDANQAPSVAKVCHKSPVKQSSGIGEVSVLPSVIGPAHFPLLRRGLADPMRFDGAVETIVAALAAGSIRNSDLNDAKSVLSRAADAAWKKHVSEPFFWAGKREAHPEATRELYDSIMIMGLHDVISASKKIARSKAIGLARDAMHAYCEEVRPLSDAVASLKPLVIKGRAPRTVPAKQENPNKIVKTCPVCFRQIAVQRGTMSHHGFQRPGFGSQTASCPGIRFKPLEVSSEGLEWLVSVLQERLTLLSGAYERRATQPEFLYVKEGYNGALVKISRADERRAQAFKRHVNELRSEMSSLKHELPTLQKMLAEWKPEQA